MFLLQTLIFIIIGISFCYILLFSFSQLHLLTIFLKRKKKEKTNKQLTHFPYVTIQLPVYNEMYVIERLLDCIENINYPKDKLQVQLLDDSTDESFEIAAKKVFSMQQKNFPIVHIKRKNRDGYKAGALVEGLKNATGEFIAIFDADFLPDKDFLLKTLPEFENKNIGMVQVAWKYVNENYSLLTQLQAFGLNAHFTIEQTARNEKKHFINFNGTAGVWKKECIEDAGNWHTDTLTEDLDLSYRAQLKKWEFVYLENLGCNSELPITITALKNQQFRWSKGAAQCAKKNLIKVWLSKNKTFFTKVFATFHLLNSSVYLTILLIAFLTLPVLLIKQSTYFFDLFFQVSPVFFTSIIIIFIFYAISFFQNRKKTFINYLRFIYYFISFLSVSMALSLHNSIAVIEGFIGIKSAFVRTPKFNIQASFKNIKQNKYTIAKISLLNIIEFLLLIYFIYTAYFCITIKSYGALPFMFMISAGLVYVLTSTILSVFKK